MLQKRAIFDPVPSSNNSDNDAKPMIYIDMDHPKVNSSDGGKSFWSMEAIRIFWKIRSVLKLRTIKEENTARLLSN